MAPPLLALQVREKTKAALPHGLRVAPGEIVGIVNTGGMRRDIIDVYG